MSAETIDRNDELREEASEQTFRALERLRVDRELSKDDLDILDDQLCGALSAVRQMYPDSTEGEDGRDE